MNFDGPSLPRKRRFHANDEGNSGFALFLPRSSECYLSLAFGSQSTNLGEIATSLGKSRNLLEVRLSEGGLRNLWRTAIHCT